MLWIFLLLLGRLIRKQCHSHQPEQCLYRIFFTIPDNHFQRMGLAYQRVMLKGNSSLLNLCLTLCVSSSLVWKLMLMKTPFYNQSFCESVINLLLLGNMNIKRQNLGSKTITFKSFVYRQFSTKKRPQCTWA